MDAINIAAIIVGPVFAVVITLWWQRRKEKRDAKERLFLTLMAHTGLFLRGDKASSLASSIRGLQQRLGDHPDPVVGAVLIQLGEIADIIERDVIVREESV